MKTVKLVSMSLGIVVAMFALAYAGGLTRPRKAYVHNYSTTPALVHAGPGAVYQVVLSTGAAGEYAVLIDSNSATGLASTQTTKLITSRLVYSSTSTNTILTFDPPLMYTNGLCVGGSAATGQAAVTYESGRALGGQ